MAGPQFAFLTADGRYGLGWIERPAPGSPWDWTGSHFGFFS